MAKIKNDYFKLIEQQVEYCVKASDLLQEILKNYSLDKAPQLKEEMHKIENSADELQHDILTRLSAEFITPIDQEDILHLVQIIDDISDCLDEVVLDFYMYNISVVPSGAFVLAEFVGKCVKALYEASKELKNFKKPTALRQLLVEVNNVESKADAAYVEAIRKVFLEETDIKNLVAAKAVYERLEKGCDMCEHAADVIEQIIIKNT